MRVFPIELKPDTVHQYDVCIWGLGYEKRSTTAARLLGAGEWEKLALGYRRNQEVLDYRENLEYFNGIGCEILEADDRDDRDEARVYARFAELIQTTSASRGKLRILIDISVLNRARLSRLIWEALSSQGYIKEIYIWYTQAEYEEPAKKSLPIRRLGPIFDNMVPFNGQLSLPLLLIAGIGYEPEKALGLISEIDPDELVALIPESEDERYNSAVLQNNNDLLESLSVEERLDYSVSHPFSCYYDLRLLVRNKLSTRRISFLPIGPKINVAVCILVAFEFLPFVTVWRASSLDEEVHFKKEASHLGPVLLGIYP